MLKTIALILLGLWLLSLALDVASGIVHVLLIVAAAVLIYDLLVGRRRARL